MHMGVRLGGQTLVFPDVFAKLEEIFIGVNRFLGNVFHFLNQGLRAEPVDALCGFFFRRGYARKLIIAEKIDFNSGVCQSRQWFDNQPEFRCPFASTCGAYAQAGAETMTRKEIVEALALDERSSLALRDGEHSGTRFKIHSPWVISRTMPVTHSKSIPKRGPERTLLLLAPAGDLRTIAGSKRYPLEMSVTDALADFLNNHAPKFTRSPSGERLSRREAHELGEPWLGSYAIRLALRLHRCAVFRATRDVVPPS